MTFCGFYCGFYGFWEELSPQQCPDTVGQWHSMNCDAFGRICVPSCVQTLLSNGITWNLLLLGGIGSPGVSRHCWAMELHELLSFWWEFIPRQCPDTVGQRNSVTSHPRNSSVFGRNWSPTVSRHCWAMEIYEFCCFLVELSPQQCPGTVGRWNSVNSAVFLMN